MKTTTRLCLLLGIILFALLMAQFAQAQRLLERGGGIQAAIEDQTKVSPLALAQDIPPPPDANDQDVASGPEYSSSENGRRIIHGSELINMRVWDPEHRQLGVIKDFIIYNPEGECPAIYFAMEPEGINEEYVIVPYNALQIRYDERERTPIVFFNIGIDQLHNAPHFARNRWRDFDDARMLTNANQFYHRVERTAAKPSFNTGEENKYKTGEGNKTRNEFENRKTSQRSENLNKERETYRQEGSTRNNEPGFQRQRSGGQMNESFEKSREGNNPAESNRR